VTRLVSMALMPTKMKRSNSEACLKPLQRAESGIIAIECSDLQGRTPKSGSHEDIEAGKEAANGATNAVGVKIGKFNVNRFQCQTILEASPHGCLQIIGYGSRPKSRANLVIPPAREELQ
jgi:hypothetical protein